MSEQDQGAVTPAEAEPQQPAQLPEDTASPEQATPEVETKPEAEKTFTQAELDEILAKRLAKAERKAQREADRRIADALKQPPKEPQQQTTEKPSAEQFKNTDGTYDSERYIEAVAEWKAKQIVQDTLNSREKAEREAKQRQQVEQRTQAWQEAEDSARDKYEDFDEVAYNPRLPISDAMAEAIQTSEVGPDLAYYLGKNPEEASRIAKLSPFIAAKELGKLEVKLSSAPPKTSKAPAPHKPLAGRDKLATDAPTDSDPMEVWLKKRNAQIAAKQAANRR